MIIEQKAKRYNEALKWMRSLYPTMTGIDKEDAEHYFPELRESEDEKIRKECISIINAWDKTCRLQGDYCEVASSCIAWLEKQGEQSFAIRWHDVSLIPREMEELLVEWDSNDATWHDVAFYHADSKTFWNGERRVEDVTRWCYIDDLLEKQGENTLIEEIKRRKELLISEKEKATSLNTKLSLGGRIAMLEELLVFANEKQGEQKPADKVEPKFYKGDWIISDTANKDYRICNIIDVKDGNYAIESIYGYKGYNQFDVFDNTYRLWDITKDAKDGDILVSQYGRPFIYNDNRDSILIGSYCGISVDGNFRVATEKCHWTENMNIHPATKEQRDALTKAMTDAGYTFDFEKKELKKIEQKPTDEEMKEILRTEYEKGRADAIAETQVGL